MTAVPYVAARLEEMSAVRLSATFFLFPFQCEHPMNLKSYFLHRCTPIKSLLHSF